MDDNETIDNSSYILVSITQIKLLAFWFVNFDPFPEVYSKDSTNGSQKTIDPAHVKRRVTHKLSEFCPGLTLQV